MLRPLCSEVPGIWGCTYSYITAFLISRLILVPDVTPGGCGQALLKSLVGAEALQLTVPTPMRARCCACFLQAINCYTEGRLCGPTGCQASCIWATAGQGSEGGLTSGREFPDFAKDSESGLQEFSAEQSWSQPVLALCNSDTDMLRGKTLMVRSPFLFTIHRPGMTCTSPHNKY